MGKVVKLDASANRPGASSRRSRAARPRRSKAALVLGGGGLTGGVYEMGALRAIDLLSVNKTVNQFDVYVGTSVGSFVAAAVANGITPEEMMRVIVQRVPTPFPDARVSSLLRPNYREFLTRGVKLPLRLAHLLATLARDVGQVSAVDIVLGLAEALPTGLYSGNGVESYVRRILSDPDRTDDFRLLRGELYLAATDLDTCERIVFGAEGWDDIPISRAVSASSALPMIYNPVKIKDREVVDGGLVSTTNLDIAWRRGRSSSSSSTPSSRTSTRSTAASRRSPARAPAGVRHGLCPDHHELHLPGRDRPPRLPVGHTQARARLRQVQAYLRPSRDRDLGHPGPQGGQAFPGRAKDPRADHLGVAAPVRSGVVRVGGGPPEGAAGGVRGRRSARQAECAAGGVRGPSVNAIVRRRPPGLELPKRRATREGWLGRGSCQSDR